MFLGYQKRKIKFYTQNELDKVIYNLEKSIETQDKYIYDQNAEEYVLYNEAYKERQKHKERERIGNLYLTRADVERGIYQAKGMDFEDILAYITQLRPQGLDLKALKIELKANHFYRGNQYVCTIGELLGFSEKQLDDFFETNDWHTLAT